MCRYVSMQFMKYVGELEHLRNHRNVRFARAKWEKISRLHSQLYLQGRRGEGVTGRMGTRRFAMFYCFVLFNTL